MSSGADLFVVCRQCGSEVSPYITECPYCGHRLRRRAPKLPRERNRGGLKRSRRVRLPLNWAHRRPGYETLASHAPPYATVALVLGGCALWIVTSSGLVGPQHTVIDGPLRSQWWRLLTAQFVYLNGVYAFVALLAIAVFGWRLERRHGPALVLALFLGTGVLGELAASALFAHPLIAGGNASALGLMMAWAAPDLRAAHRREWHEGDLIGVAAFAAALLVLPLVRPEANWLAGVTGAGFGLIVGLGLSQIASPSEL